LIDSAAFYDENLTRISKNSKNHTMNNLTDFTIRIREPTTTMNLDTARLLEENFEVTFDSEEGGKKLRGF
jgi:hypothetical protein